ncbi:MAG: Lrp/AsnC family leucine-responsive transcriptional regulator [Bermanella sp.]|jgi:Lrp/AsnC family leucine-responsive transcriptional regulator|uniref:Lrp/AsnC family transcriptional regulator n=1 Tax=Glaciecola sp. 33A TaxID=2057807 RepID=UPI000C34955A|nr:Lrp/AsnC family transcriptional regulator [Glaciecola sp. 33A]PKI01070.1 Lrp/AsnC family transcriptional regulator [Glaciecola sp. 33A]
MKGIVLDDLDLHIIRLLEEDGRQSFSLLGEKVGLSKTPCWNRVNRLQNAGVIEGYGARINPQKLGLEVRALVQVIVEFADYKAFEQAVNKHRSIDWCQAITGEFDYIMQVLADNIGELDSLLREELSGLPGVHRFTTSISTRVIKAAKGVSRT